MTLLSSHLLIQSSSLTLIVLSYLLLTSPAGLLQWPSVDLLGSSMHIPPASFVPLTDPSKFSSTLPASLRSVSPTLSQSTRELLALAALILFLTAVSQSVLANPLRHSPSSLLQTEDGKRKDSRALGEEVHTLHAVQSQWMVLAGLRVLITGVLSGWIYIGYSERNLITGNNVSAANAARVSDLGGVGLLANRVVFAIGMSDMLFWGYLWTVLREEMREVGQVIARRREQDEEEEQNQR